LTSNRRRAVASINKECSVLKPVMASAVESEVAGIFINAQKGLTYRTTLQEIGHV